MLNISKMQQNQFIVAQSPKLRHKKNSYFSRMKKISHSKILDIINLTDSTYIVRLEKNNFEFKAGQYLVLNIPGENMAREYSIYSEENAPYIDLLIKEVTDGKLSKELKYIKIGTKVEISGPFGFFILRDRELNQSNHYTFVATGTGISPFHSMVLSNPGLNCEVIHGIKHNGETYESADYPTGCYKACTSKDHGANFFGRVTQYLKVGEIRKDSLYYICGNSGMVGEVSGYLELQGVPPENIRTEVFF